MVMPLSEENRGTLLSVIAYLIWGLSALYWVEAYPVAPADILAHRALWSVVFVFTCLLLWGRLGSALAYLRNPKTVVVMAAAASCSAANWLVFLWAVTNGKATEASLGYFLMPLFNVVIGLTLFKESLDNPQKIGVAFAVAAVLLQLWYFQGLPLVALGLPLSFGIYGAIRKKVDVGSVEGLFIETLLMAPFAIAWLWFHDWGGLGQYGLKVDLFLLGAGAFTAIPLMAYVVASRLLPLTALGLVFYIGPTTQLMVAVLIFKEPFNTVQLVAFTLVWVGLFFVVADSLRRSRLWQRLRGVASEPPQV